MPLEFIGMIGTQHASEIHPPRGPVIDKDYLATLARAHEFAGFDRVLIGYFAGYPDGMQVAAWAATQTRRIGLLLAHRPGFIAPTLAARSLATLDQFADGRLALHVITGGSDVEQRRDGDYLDHDARYARTDEYLSILRRLWAGGEAWDHDGDHYRFEGAFSAVRPVGRAALPIYFGGSSDAAIEVAARHADVFALWGEPLEQVRETVARVRAAAARHGREDAIRFSLSLRPILAETEDAAWARADRILARARDVVAHSPIFAAHGRTPPQAVGSRRLLEAAARGRVLDKRLWTEIAALTGAPGNSTALVGTPDQVAESLLDYWDAGITTFLIRGFDPVEDALAYGRELLPRIRAEVAGRAARPAAAE